MMDPFPVAPELMQAFPLGALSLLVTVASTVAARHGVDRARSICRELADNDELWGFVAARVERRHDGADDVASDAEREMPSLLGSSGPPEEVRSKDAPALGAVDESVTEHHDMTTAPESDASAELAEVPQEPPARPRRSKSKRRQKNKTNGAGR